MMISYNSKAPMLQEVTIRAGRRKTLRIPLIFLFFCFSLELYALSRDEESTRLQRLLDVCREIKTGKKKKGGKTKKSQNVYVYNNNK